MTERLLEAVEVASGGRVVLQIDALAVHGLGPVRPGFPTEGLVEVNADGSGELRRALTELAARAVLIRVEEGFERRHVVREGDLQELNAEAVLAQPQRMSDPVSQHLMSREAPFMQRRQRLSIHGVEPDAPVLARNPCAKPPLDGPTTRSCPGVTSTRPA